MICVDASVATKWALPEPDSPLALDLFEAARAAGDPVIAPPFMPIEVTNAVWRRVVLGQLDRANAGQMLSVFLRFEVRLEAPPNLYETALELADHFKRPTVYEMHYVGLAQLVGCDLWTADQRLLNVVGGRLPFVKALSALRS